MRSPPCAVGLVSGSMIFSCSMIEPGHPWRDDERQRILMLRTNVNEMNVEPIDLGDELRQRVEPRLHFAPIVFCRPIVRELLNGRELYALRCVRDGFLLRPDRRIDASAQIDKRLFRKVDAEWTDRLVLVTVLDFAAVVLVPEAWASFVSGTVPASWALAVELACA